MAKNGQLALRALAVSRGAEAVAKTPREELAALERVHAEQAALRALAKRRPLREAPTDPA